MEIKKEHSIRIFYLCVHVNTYNEKFKGDYMRFFIFILALVSFGATAQTVINYDDGSTLTLVEGEMIHVTKGKLYQQRTYNSGRTFQFKEFPETTRRDYVEVDNGTDDTDAVGRCDERRCDLVDSLVRLQHRRRRRLLGQDVHIDGRDLPCVHRDL